MYTNFVTPKLSKLIEEAEIKSDEVCEECGSTNDVGKRLNGWITTMCLDCVKKEAKEKDCPQLWERNSNNKRYWIMEDGKVEEIEAIEGKKEKYDDII